MCRLFGIRGTVGGRGGFSVWFLQRNKNSCCEEMLEAGSRKGTKSRLFCQKPPWMEQLKLYQNSFYMSKQNRPQIQTSACNSCCFSPIIVATIPEIERLLLLKRLPQTNSRKLHNNVNVNWLKSNFLIIKLINKKSPHFLAHKMNLNVNWTERKKWWALVLPIGQCVNLSVSRSFI